MADFDMESATSFADRAFKELCILKGNRKALGFGKQKLNLHQRGQEFEPKAKHPTCGSADLCLITTTPLTTVAAHLKVLHSTTACCSEWKWPVLNPVSGLPWKPLHIWLDSGWWRCHCGLWLFLFSAGLWSEDRGGTSGEEWSHGCHHISVLQRSRPQPYWSVKL